MIENSLHICIAIVISYYVFTGNFTLLQPSGAHPTLYPVCFLPEPVPVACSRVDALRSHGYTCEALRLAVAVVRTLKQAQREAYLWWGSKRDEMLPRCSASRACRSLGPGALESWVGHPLDPITCLFDTLAEASLLPEDLPRFQYHSGKSRNKFLRYSYLYLFTVGVL